VKRATGFTPGVRQQRIGELEFLRPFAAALDAVGAHARDRDARSLELLVECAKLAHLDHSAGSSISQIEEQHLRSGADVATQAIEPARAGKLEIGEIEIEQTLGSRAARHA